MEFTPLVSGGRQAIQAYGDGGFRVSGTAYRGSVLVFAAETRAWPVAVAAEITLESLAPVAAAAGEVELLLLGCGRAPALVPAALRDHLRAAGIVLEIMDTGAACRTFNVLAGESRLVAAALIAVD